MTSTNRIGTWLNDLAALTAGAAPLADAKAKVAALTAMLNDQFPPEAFTRTSLEAVASNCKFFPAYAELQKQLASWWKNNKPPQRALSGTSLDPSDQACVTVWLKRRNSGEITNLANSLDMLRCHQPNAFDHLIATDQQCRHIANQRGWISHTDDARNDWTDLSEITLTRKLLDIEKTNRNSPAIAAAQLSLLRTTVAKYAPQLQHLLPIQFSQPDQSPRSIAEQLHAFGIITPTVLTAAEQFQHTHGRKPGELTPEQLDAINPLPNGRKRGPHLAQANA